eukprot:7370823-Pyramimonas_sp.AAC.1
MDSGQPKMPPRGPKGPQEDLPPTGCEDNRNTAFRKVFDVCSHHRFPVLSSTQNGPRSLQDGPKTAQEACTGAPRRRNRTP